MTCSLCKGVALYQAGKRFFCRDHRDEAYEAMREVSRNVCSRVALGWSGRHTNARTVKRAQIDVPTYGRTVVE